jgi:hypothetical protein
MKKIPPNNDDDGTTVIDGTKPADLVWDAVKLIASMLIALVSALWLDAILSKL